MDAHSPPIEGFDIDQHDGRWRATATSEITPVMAAYGCRTVIHADTIADLNLLCCAERIKADQVRAAQRACT